MHVERRHGCNSCRRSECGKKKNTRMCQILKSSKKWAELKRRSITGEKMNRVSFDQGKQEIVVVHPSLGEGPDFKLLGCTFDVKLTMKSDVDQLVCKIRLKVKALLRTKGLYDAATMLQQYKKHIWGHIEHHSGAILHACATVLCRLDAIQSSFLQEMHLTAQVGFLDYNLAPTVLRRDIGLLGFIHKRVLGECHAGIMQLLPFHTGTAVYHSKQLDSKSAEVLYRRELYNRSIFALVRVYNMLPQFVVDMTSVTGFQKALTRMARRRCAANDPEWPLSYRDCDQIWDTLRWANDDD